MPTIDAAVDDYLHLIIRTRPWTKAREEALLTALVEWIYAQPNQARSLGSATPALVERYVAARQLSADERDELGATLTRLFGWAVGAALVDHNPYDALVTA